MKTILLYLVAVVSISAVLYGYYYLALRNKKFHFYNRFYLLAATLLSIFIPLFNIPVYLSEKESQSSFVFKSLSVISGTDQEEELKLTTVITSTNWFTIEHIIYLFYLLLALVFLAKMILSLFRIRHIIRQNPDERIGTIHFINTDEPGTPFSFFNWMFWNRKIELQSEKGEQIFRHELFHITQKHSIDILFTELVTVIFWFNPFFHFIKRELKAIHEFLADRHAVTENTKWQYAELLLMQALQTKHSLVNPFFHNQIKRRIAMITQSQKPGPQYFRKLMFLPLGVFALALFAFNYKNKKETDPVSKPDKPFVVVIDAGHGGSDGGAKAPDGTFEKDFTLAIAQKIKVLNRDKNIEIHLTRNDDTYPGLQDRVDLATRKNADLFITIHVNTASPSFQKKNSQQGFEVVISDKNKRFEPQNKILATILLNYLSQLYPTNMDIIKKTTGVYILSDSPCPSVLLECGYLSNEKDLAYLKNSDNQEKIAASILKGIDQYKMQMESEDWESRKEIYSDTTSFFEKISKDKTQDEKMHVWRNKKTGNRLAFIADSFVLRANPNNPKPNLDNSLYIIDGNEVTHDFLNNNIISAKLMTVYPPGDEEATAKYGEKAKKGVIVFEGVSVEQTLHESLHKTDTVKPGETVNIVFDRVEVQAKFPGGQQKWFQYLTKNLDVLTPVKNNAPEGSYTVMVQFIVDKQGTISNIRSLTKHGYGMEEEAIRIISKGPKWEPAIQNGKIVKAYVKQPITFVVNNDQEKSIESPNDVKPNKEVVVVGFNKKNENNEPIFDKSEVEPSFPGGDAAWRKYLERNANPNIAVYNEAPKGVYKVMVQYVVYSDGSISNIRALTSHGYGMEAEAIHLLQNSPAWIPGMQNGKKINAYRKQPITFIVEERNEEKSTEKRKIPEISLEELKRISLLEMLNLKNDMKILSFIFNIDDDQGKVHKDYTTGDQFSATTKGFIQNASKGRTVIIESIRGIKDEKEIKLPAVVYRVI